MDVEIATSCFQLVVKKDVNKKKHSFTYIQ